MQELILLVSGGIAGFVLCYCAMVNPMKRQQVQSEARLNGILDMMEESVRMRLIHKLGDGVDIGSR